MPRSRRLSVLLAACGPTVPETTATEDATATTPGATTMSEETASAGATTTTTGETTTSTARS